MTGEAQESPVVSCVLIFLDGERFIEEAIRSVVGQEGFDRWELILVDDGSTDRSTALAKGWAATDPDRIRYVEHAGHENRGMSASRNLGVAVAAGIYIGFLDCDDVWLPSALAHRMRVAAAHPTADVIVGGTWWWYSWTGRTADLALDEPTMLPVAAPLTTMPAPRLFFSIYEIPDGARVPAICSFLVRRESLLAIGGMETEFRGMYEDQVLYVKAGLKLGAVLDPRPLALYRQHDESACSVAIRDGQWQRDGSSEAAEHFFAWMEEYTRHEAGSRTPELQVVEHNIAHARARLVKPPPTRRQRLRRHAPDHLVALVRWARRRRSRPGVMGASPTIPTVWSAQYLPAITRPMTGTVLVVAPSRPADEPWTGVVPDDAFGGGAHVERRPLGDGDSSGRVDHVVVPLAAAVELSTAALLAAIHRVLRPGGTATALLPGRAWSTSRKDGTEHADAGATDADRVAILARELFPDSHISVERFGNPVTAAAVAARTPANAVVGVAIDHHDGCTEVLVGVCISSSRDGRVLDEGS